MGGLLRNYGIKRISGAFKRKCLNVRSYAVLCRKAKGLDQFLARPGRRTQQPPPPHRQWNGINFDGAGTNTQNNHRAVRS